MEEHHSQVLSEKVLNDPVPYTSSPETLRSEPAKETCTTEALAGELAKEGGVTKALLDPSGDLAEKAGSQENVVKETGSTDENWATLLIEMRQYDKDMIDSWKDEMGNLLIFAGLFSSIVTAFTVDSYQTLQQDPADMSVQLLQRISLQLSSFTVTSGFANSTFAGTTNLDSLQSGTFSPSPLSITINNLWFLSLTLSLIAAFFAIAIQQWLRRRPLPQQLSVRDVVRMRQLRYEGLHEWQVPTIVAILPVFMQVALILFLVGLSYLLKSLNHTISLTFTITAAVLLSVYAIASLVPVVKASCPYKSAWLPSTVYVLRTGGVVLFDVVHFTIGVMVIALGMAGVALGVMIVALATAGTLLYMLTSALIMATIVGVGIVVTFVLSVLQCILSPLLCLLSPVLCLLSPVLCVLAAVSSAVLSCLSCISGGILITITMSILGSLQGVEYSASGFAEWCMERLEASKTLAGWLDPSVAKDKALRYLNLMVTTYREWFWTVPAIVDPGEFWTIGERRKLLGDSSELDRKALDWAPQALSRAMCLKHGASCAHDLVQPHRARWAVNWTSAFLSGGAYDPGLNFNAVKTAVEFSSLQMVDKYTITRSKAFLFSSLPSEEEWIEYKEEPSFSCALLLLHDMETVIPDDTFRLSFCRLLIAIQDAQTKEITGNTTGIEVPPMVYNQILKDNRHACSSQVDMAHKAVRWAIEYIRAYEKNSGSKPLRQAALYSTSTALFILRTQDQSSFDYETRQDTGELYSCLSTVAKLCRSLSFEETEKWDVVTLFHNLSDLATARVVGLPTVPVDSEDFNTLLSHYQSFAQRNLPDIGDAEASRNGSLLLSLGLQKRRPASDSRQSTANIKAATEEIVSQLKRLQRIGSAEAVDVLIEKADIEASSGSDKHSSKVVDEVRTVRRDSSSTDSND